MFLIRQKQKYGPGRQGLLASPWPGISQVPSTPGGRDSGRLGLSLRTWLAEAAKAGDLKGGLGGEAPPATKVYTFLGLLELG